MEESETKVNKALKVLILSLFAMSIIILLPVFLNDSQINTTTVTKTVTQFSPIASSFEIKPNMSSSHNITIVSQLTDGFWTFMLGNVSSQGTIEFDFTSPVNLLNYSSVGIMTFGPRMNGIGSAPYSMAHVVVDSSSTFTLFLNSSSLTNFLVQVECEPCN